MVDAIRGYGLGARGPARGATPREGFRLPRAAGPAPAAGVGGISAASVQAQNHGITDAERDDAAARRGGALLAEMTALQGSLLMGGFRIRRCAASRIWLRARRAPTPPCGKYWMPSRCAHASNWRDWAAEQSPRRVHGRGVTHLS